MSSFDTVPWKLVVRAVQAVTDSPWVLLYVKRWLAAPLQHPDGTRSENDDLAWPHRDGLIWPHFSSVVVGLDVA